MGQIADDIIDGLMCSWCGVYFENAHGYPVACKSCWEEALKDLTKKDEVQRIDGKIIMVNGVQPATEREL